jgi:two-component system KDP operon response regulator KdpE
MSGVQVLVCDDELQILRALRVVLKDAGFEVVATATGEEALDAASVHPPNAAIIDLVLPDLDGVEVTKQLRQWSQMPILVLSAVGDETEKIRALNAGADDYVTKPFNPGELIARLNAVLRRAGGAPDDPRVAVGDVEIDVGAHQVRLAGEPVHLTKTEFELLRVLAVNRGRLMTHRALLLEVWGPGYEHDKQVLRVHMANLRGKVEQDGRPRLIHTDPGVGYRLDG